MDKTYVGVERWTDSEKCEILEKLMEFVVGLKGDPSFFSMSRLKNMLPYTYFQDNFWLLWMKYFMFLIMFSPDRHVTYYVNKIYKTHWKPSPGYSQYTSVRLYYLIVMNLAFISS